LSCVGRIDGLGTPSAVLCKDLAGKRYNQLRWAELNARLTAANNKKIGLLDFSSRFEFLWINSFPLFTVEDDTVMSTHHPFTAPEKEDVHLLKSDPLRVSRDDWVTIFSEK
jgi:aspartyl-tRNA synthetase